MKSKNEGRQKWGFPHYDFLRSEFGSASSVDDLIVIRFSLGFVFEQLAEVSEEPLPVTRHILHAEMIQNKVLAPHSNFFCYSIMFFHKLKQFSQIRQVLFDRNVVNPWLELRVEELKPVLADMKNQRSTQEKMLQTEASSHTSEVKKVSDGWREQKKKNYNKIS